MMKINIPLFCFAVFLAIMQFWFIKKNGNIKI